MKPDEVVNALKDKWGLSITRRTVLTYEKEGLAAPPFIETGKSKEYPIATLAEIIASWGLIHGEYGLRPKKVAEIRAKALQIIYAFPKIWKEEIITVQGVESLREFIKKGVSYKRAGDYFVLTWLMARMSVLDYKENTIVDSIKEFLRTGSFKHVPKLCICSEYSVSGECAHHVTTITYRANMSSGSICIQLIAGANKIITINYVHPEDFAETYPAFQYN